MLVQCHFLPPPPKPLSHVIHPELHNINLHNATHSLISRNPREWMFIVQISLLIVKFLTLISFFLSLLQTIKEVNPHPHIAPCVNMWSVFFFCHLLNIDACICHITWTAKWNGPHHTLKMLQFVLFHSVTCYINSIVSRFHVNTTKPCDITCTLVATCVILRSN